MSAVEQRLREDVVREERSRDRARDGGRRGPGDDTPVDAALTSMLEPAGTGSRGRDGDVRPGGGEWASGDENDERQAQRPQHETQHRSEIPGDERTEKRYAELPGLQSGSSRPSDAFAALARMKRRSERRFRYTSTSGLSVCTRRGTQHLALRPSTDRACNVQERRKLAAARKNEAPELRQGSVEAVALALQASTWLLRDTKAPLVSERDRESAPRSKSSFCTRASTSRISPGSRRRVRARVPSSARPRSRTRRSGGRASTRAYRLPSEVSPASPPRV